MKGKSPRTINTKYNNVFAKWFNVFQALTDVDDGKYYFEYIVVFEFIEITLQMATFDVMVRENDLNYVFVSVLILSLNLLTTPLAFVSSKLNPELGRKATYITDACLESAYFGK